MCVCVGTAITHLCAFVLLKMMKNCIKTPKRIFSDVTASLYPFSILDMHFTQEHRSFPVLFFLLCSLFLTLAKRKKYTLIFSFCFCLMIISVYLSVEIKGELKRQTEEQGILTFCTHLLPCLPLMSLALLFETFFLCGMLKIYLHLANFQKSF